MRALLLEQTASAAVSAPRRPIPWPRSATSNRSIPSSNTPGGRPIRGCRACTSPDEPTVRLDAQQQLGPVELTGAIDPLDELGVLRGPERVREPLGGRPVLAGARHDVESAERSRTKRTSVIAPLPAMAYG